MEGHQSIRLREFICKYSNRLSYQAVATLVNDVTGFGLVSGQHACNLVKASAQLVVEAQNQTLAKTQLCIPFIDQVDLYDKTQSELLILEDAIGVKRQKQQRKDKAYQKPTQTVQTDVLMVQNGITSRKFSAFVAHKDNRLRLESQLMCHLSHYNKGGSLPLLVIADGARTIRKKLTDLLGNRLLFILDWYHLSDKIWQYMSQIAPTKAQKQAYATTLIGLLWKGQVGPSLDYLQTEVRAKNEQKKQELIEYLTKHQLEIIDYDRRKNAGKTIGSGCVEKANDLIVAHRQKKKGMAWSNDGSESLAILKTLEINQGWEQFWNKAA